MATCSHDNKVRLFDMSILNEDEEESGKREHESELSEEEGEKFVKARNLKRRKVTPNNKSSGFYDDL